MTFVFLFFFYPTQVLMFIFFSNFISFSHLYHNQIRHDTDDTLNAVLFLNFFLVFSGDVTAQAHSLVCEGLMGRMEEMSKVLLNRIEILQERGIRI